MAAKLEKNIIVLGAGVVGLTTAVQIQEQGGYQVSIIADVFPTDEKTIKYTSIWAGAHHVLNVTEDVRQQRMDMETFKWMWDLSEPGTETAQYFMRLIQTEYYTEEGLMPPFERMPQFQMIPKDKIPPGYSVGCTFQTVTIDTPRYLCYLLERFTTAGGLLVKGYVQHIDQVIEGGTEIFHVPTKANAPDAVVVCTGIGTRFLGGIEDKNVYPLRGQTVIIRAPWINFGRTFGNRVGWTYVIPRQCGEVVLGGTNDCDDWYPLPRPEMTRDILERAFEMCPELAPPEIRAQREPVLEDVSTLVIEEGCGLRPGRIGGICLDVEWRNTGRRRDKAMIPVVFNYGHGGYGYQSSWGSANLALELLENTLREKS